MKKLLVIGTEVCVFDKKQDMLRLGKIMQIAGTVIDPTYIIKHQGCVPYVMVKKRNEFEPIELFDGYDDFYDKIRDRMNG